MQTLLGKHWHHLDTNEVILLLETEIECGLDVFEIGHRQQRFGANELTPKKGKSPFVKFLLQFNNPLVYILLASTIIIALLKDWKDAIIIFLVILLNAVIGYLQESKAESAIEALKEAMTTETTVIRSGKNQRILANELVPGDVVLLKSGDKVPADLRLIRTRDLQVAEAALTGESLPVFKDAMQKLEPDTPLAERQNMVYASTLVTYGQGTGVVTSIGDSTEIGRISQLIASAPDLTTPLTRRIQQFSRLLMFLILGLAIFTFFIGLLRNQPWIDMLVAAITLAVAMIPEGLPAALTVTLSLGVSRMARRRVIIRKLPAVETLGSATIICSDKTGTLTQNQMTVQQIVTPNGCYEVSGSGYNPNGEINGVIEKDDGLFETLKAGVLCNDSELSQDNWQPQGDPTEVALITAGYKAGMPPDNLKESYPRLDYIPFESQHQYMVTLHEDSKNNTRIAYLKGAVEVILTKCAYSINRYGQMVELDPEQIHENVKEMALRGLRVLAFARKELPGNVDLITHNDIESHLTFLGLQGMIDLPRPEAIAAVRACQSAGIRVKMITGDHALTAGAIAHQIGLDDASQSVTPKVLTGTNLAALKDEELIQEAENTSVFARVSPEQKLRLVEALQKNGHIVAMTGDGVNDGPALKQADIGIAMGITGTDVAKEAADVVVTDDNFSSIEAAVEEGRGVFDNLTKQIAWMLPTNIGMGLIIMVSLLIGLALPILPIQVLWINLISSGALGIALANEVKEPGIMQRSPRKTNAPILNTAIITRIIVVSLLMLVGTFWLFEWEILRGASLEEARTVAINVVVFIQVFYLLNCRSLTYNMFRIGLFSNPWALLGIGIMILLQVLLVYLPAFNLILQTAPLDIEAWVRVLLISLTVFILIEVEKWLRLKRSQPKLTLN